jgi:hypothetical protein
MTRLHTGIAGLLLAAWAAWASPALAHHSFDAMYDRSKTQVMKGAVTKVEWTNPHARFYLDVMDERGRVVNWNMELGSPNGLRRAGWNRNSLKVGDVVSVTVSLARNGTRLANAREVVLADGKKVFTATAGAS